MAATRERIRPEAGKLVDMAWDPITRIVDNLGSHPNHAQYVEQLTGYRQGQHWTGDFLLY